MKPPLGFWKRGVATAGLPNVGLASVKPALGVFGIREEARGGSVAVLVAALLRVRPQFRLVFTELLRVLRVRGRGRGVQPLSGLGDFSERNTQGSEERRQSVATTGLPNVGLASVKPRRSGSGIEQSGG